MSLKKSRQIEGGQTHKSKLKKMKNKECHFTIVQQLMLITIGLFSLSLIQDGIAIGIIFTYKLPEVVWGLMNISIWLKILTTFTVITVSVFQYLFDHASYIMAIWMEILLVCGLIQIPTMLATYSTSSSEHFEMEIHAGHIIFFFIYLVTFITEWSFVASNFKLVLEEFRQLQESPQNSPSLIQQ